MAGFVVLDITQEDYDKEIRAEAIDDFAERLQTKIISEIDDCADELEWIEEIAEQMKGKQNEGLQ